MQRAWLSGTEAAAVSDAVTRVLRARNAIVDEHTATQVVFEGLRTDNGAGTTFERGGVATLVQPAGEKEVEVRLRVRARLTSRILWTTVSAVVGAGLAIVVLNPRAGVWVAAGVLLWASFLLAVVLHLGTLRASRAIESDLLGAVLEEARPAAEAVLREEDRLLAQAEDEIEAELLARRLRAKGS